jgi:Na+/H+ antiporter NhaD/arsenite permease-like protein
MHVVHGEPYICLCFEIKTDSIALFAKIKTDITMNSFRLFVHSFQKSIRFSPLVFILLIPLTVCAQDAGSMPSLLSIRIEFYLFAATLIGVALFHRHTMYVALTGLAIILSFKLTADAHFSLLHHITGTNAEVGEWRTLLNLCGLLMGFAILAKHFEKSNVPDALPEILPGGWKGGLILLLSIFIMSAFLDNIAAAMIGGTIAMIVFRGKVHIGFLAAIVAASNAGGAGSVIGDTTTTLMWIEGISPFTILRAFIASFAAFLVFGVAGSLQQERYQPLQKNPGSQVRIDWARIFIVAFILVCTILTNVLLEFPALGVWIGIVVGAFIRKTPWQELKKAWQGTVFLMCLVFCASLMPVDELPVPSWKTAFVIGLISSVFDNIPLTKLCLEQGNYDWGILAYAVGFGGSMIWFGSSAGVALSNMFPELRSVARYFIKGWHVAIAYIVGFFLMLLLDPWHAN